MIRRLTPDDYDALIELWKEAGLEFKPLGRDSRASIEHQMNAAPDTFWGYFVNDRLIGSILITDDGRKGWINRLAVLPSFRKQNIGATLIRFAERFLMKKGIEIVAALIYDTNTPSLNLFKKCGYEICSDIKYLRHRFRQDI